MSRSITKHLQIEQVDLSLLNLIANNINDIIAVNTPDGSCRYISPSVSRVLGYSPKELIGVVLLDYYHPDDVQRIRELYQRAMAGAPVIETRFEYQFRRKDGSYAWMQSETTRILDSAGKLVKILSISRDITKSKAMETELKYIEQIRRESEQKLRNFAQAVPDVSMILDQDGLFIDVFGQSEQLLAMPHEMLIGFSLRQALSAQNAEHIVLALQRTIRTGIPQQYTCELEVNGAKHVTEWRIAPMDYLNNGKKTAVAVVVDVTEKRRCEKMLDLSFSLRRRTEFIDAIIQGKTLDKRAGEMAIAFGIDLSTPLCCCIIHVERECDARVCSNANPVSVLLQNSIIDLVASYQNLFVWDCRGDIGIIHQSGRAMNNLDESMQTAHQLMDQIKTYDPHFTVTMGVGETHSGFEGIRKSYWQAAKAALVARNQCGVSNGICHFREIGIYQFLAHNSDKEQAAEFVQDRIGRLIEHDRKHKTSFLKTLEEILQSANLKEASSRLYLHYNTTVFRKRRIERILGVSVDEFETRLALNVAVKLYRLSL